jgi:type IV pilus biogenesis protein CpaD/CtpE
MRSILLSLLAAGTLAACADPVAQQAVSDTRYTPTRADRLVAVDFAPGSARLDPAQERELHVLAAGRRPERDEFVVLTDGSGGAIQHSRVAQVARSLSHAGARWISTSVEPAVARGPDQVLVVRSEYRIATRNCPTYTPSGTWNPNEANMPGAGCADAYNMGQMLARPRDAAIGRAPGPVEGTVAADAIQRYREGRVRAPSAATTTGGAGGGGGGGGAATSTP